MVDTIADAAAVSGAPSYNGRMLRQTKAAHLAGATTARPLGGLTGVRPGTSITTVTASSTTWSVGPFAGVADVQTAAVAGPYEFAFDAITTGTIATASAAGPRTDIIYVQIDDPAESDGSTVPAATRKYLAGTAGAGAPTPALPVSRAFIIALISVPVSGGGSPTVTWNAPYTVAAGGILPIATYAKLSAIVGYAGQSARVTGDTLALNGTYVSDGTTWNAANTFQITGTPAGTNGTAIPSAGSQILTKVHYITGTTAADSTLAFTFPTAFPNACAHLSITTLGGSAYNPVVNAGALTRSGATLAWSGLANTAVTFTILAVGW